MIKKIVLSFEEKNLLEKLDNDTLHFIKGIYNDKNFPNLLKMMEMLVDMEKNQFFSENETPDLPIKHAYARGRVAGVLTNIHLFAGAELELNRREKERKK